MFYSKESVQADFAERAKKSLSAIQYFFQYAKWDVRALSTARLSVLRNKKETIDRRTDILVLDGCPLAKDKNAVSQLISKIWDNRKKQVVNGYELFGAAIVTAGGYHYPLHVMLFFPEKWRSVFCGWISFLRRCLRKTKAKLVVIDRGFRNKYFLHAIREAKRHFLVRVDESISGLFPELLRTKKKRNRKGGGAEKRRRGRKKKFPGRSSLSLTAHLKKSKDVRIVQMRKGLLTVVPNVIAKAWSDTISSPGSILVIKRDGFKNPLVLFSSESDISLERALELVQCYYRRWKIEQMFKEAKQLFSMENFRVTTVKAIMRCIHIAMFCHTLLFVKQLKIFSMKHLKLFIEFYLKKKRNIKKLTLSSLKIFYEKCHEFRFDFTPIIPLFLQEKMGFEV